MQGIDYGLMVGGDINFDIKVMHGYRRFCNKIYQATKYVLGKLPSDFVPLEKASRTGQESVAEKWILHKFSTTARDINKALQNRQFAEATSLSYQYFYTNLCDVYIENSKSIIQDGAPEAQLSAQQTLYTALEGGLRLLHPFMPFLTEELWQRLPRRPSDECPSIVRAAYPEFSPHLIDEGSEEAYELVMATSRAIRSLAGEYDIKEAAEVHLQPKSDKAQTTCEEQIASIKSLGGKITHGAASRIGILATTDHDPTGCVVQAVGSSLVVFLVVKGRIDLDDEIKKANLRLAKTSELVKKQEKIMHGDGWTKMRSDVQQSERQKLVDAQAEVDVLASSIRRFETLKLE